MKNAILEIGTEPMPPSFQASAHADLAAAALERFKEEGLACASVVAYATARRIALVVGGVDETGPRGAAAAALARAFPKLVAGLKPPSRALGLLAVYGRSIVPFRVEGLASGNKALASPSNPKPILVPDASLYAQTLAERGVILEADKRRAAVSAALDKASEESGIWVDKDPALIEDAVTRLESPACVTGRFSHECLRLPQPLLAKVLKGEFKFFPMLSMAGKPQPGFAALLDGPLKSPDALRAELERSVSGRFDRVRALYESDLRTRLRDKVEGELRATMERTVELAIWLCGSLWRRGVKVDLGTVEAIARLAHANLASAVVKEFPEFHGLMGGHYARRDGEWERVASGVEEYGLPSSPGGPLPSRLECSVASAAGKMDSLVAAGNPAEARNAATGVVRIVLERSLPVSLLELAAKAGSLAPASRPAPDWDARELLWGCAESWFLEKGFSADEVSSVRDHGLEDLSRTHKRLQALRAFRQNPGFADLSAACRRAAELLAKAGAAPASYVLDRNLIESEAEAALYGALNRAEKAVLERVAREDYERSLKELTVLAPGMDRFLVSVHILEAEDNLRRNRLALLARLLQLARSVADLSRIKAIAS